MLPTLVRRFLLALVLIGVVAGIWTALVLVQVRSDLTSARAELEQARTAGDLDDAAPVLGRAEDRLERALSRLRQPGPVLVAAVPIAGRSLDAVEAVTAAALAVVTSTGEVLEAATGEQPLLDGEGVDVATLDEVRQALERAEQGTSEPLAALRAQSTSLVPGVVADPVAEAKAEFAGVDDTFLQAAAGLRALTALLGSPEPRTLLVLLENNAELRGTGGLVTVFAEVTAQDGRLDIGPFRDVEQVADTPPDVTAVPAPEDYVDLYGPFLANTTLWKNTNMSPDIPTSSAVLADVAALTLPTPPDAMLWLDVPAIAGMLEATGPVELPDGRELSAGNAVELLLSRAYREAPDTPEGQAQRRAVLRAAADAVIGRVLRGSEGTSLPDLAPVLADAADGRHLALWSAVEAEQADLVLAGLAGEVDADGGDLSSFAVQNLGGGDREGNKLDYYARREVRVRAVVGEDAAEVEQEVVLRNTTPPDEPLPVYVTGGGTPRTSNNLVSLALPVGAEVLEFTRSGSTVLTSPRPAGDHAVMVDLVALPAGTEATWRLRYRLPVTDDDYVLHLVPQPLAFAAELDVEVTAASGVELSTEPGSPLGQADDGALRLQGPFEEELALRVDTERPGRLSRFLDGLRRFWNEPLPRP